MKWIRKWLNAITWATWMDLEQPKWLTPIVKWCAEQRAKRFEV